MYNLQPVTPNMLIPNVKGRCPFQPPVQTRQHMLQYVTAVTGWLIDNLQNNANQSVQRLFTFYQMYNSGQWNTPVFVGLVSDTLDLMDFKMNAQRIPPEAAIASAVDEMVNVTIAKITYSNQQLFHSLPPDVQNVIQQWLQHDRSIAASMVQFLQFQQPQMQQQMPYGYPQQQQVTAMGFNNAFSQPAQNSYYQSPQPRGITQPGQQGVVYTSTTIPANAGAPDSNHRAFRTETALSANSPLQQQYQQVVPTQPVAAVVEQKVETVYDRIARGESIPIYPDIFNIKSTEFAVPIPVIFDIDKQIAFVEKPSGSNTIRYRLEAKENSNMNYQDHKNFHLLPKGSNSGPVSLTKPDGFAMDKIFANMMNMRAAEDAIAEFEKNHMADVIDENTSVAILQHTIINRVIETKNTNYREVAAIYFDDKGINIDADNSLIALHVVDIPRFGAGPEVQELYKGPMNASFNPNNPHSHIAKAVKALVGILPDTDWELLDKNLTSFINGRLKFCMGLEGASIDSYCDDIEEMVNLISENIPNLLSDFNTRIVSQMRKACLDVNGNSLAYIDDMDMEDEVSQVFFSTVETVFLLPIFSRDFTLGSLDGESGVVTYNTSPVLYGKIEECFKMAHERARYVKFVLRDNATIYLYPCEEEDNRIWLSTLKY